MATPNHRRKIKSSIFEIVTVKDADFIETTDRWHELREQVRWIRNSLTSMWYTYHFEKDAPIILQNWVRLDRKWAKYKNELQRWTKLDKKKRAKLELTKPEKPRGKTRPKLPVNPIPDELMASMMTEMKRRFPNMGAYFLGYVYHTWKSNLTGKNATNSAYKAWIFVLIGGQAVESAKHDAPIPFGRQMFELIPPDKDEKFYSAKLKLSRTPHPDPDRKDGILIDDHMIMRCGGKKIKSQLTLLEQIVRGIALWNAHNVVHLAWRKAKKAALKANRTFNDVEPEPPNDAYDFKGSQLIYRENKRKWFLSLSYEMPVRECPDLDKDKTAYLHVPEFRDGPTLFSRSKNRPSFTAGKTRPLTLRLPGLTREHIKDRQAAKFQHWPGGWGDYIKSKRRSTFLQRRSRSNSQQHANTNSKGHGRNRATKWRWLFQKNWTDFVKTVNGQMASSIVRKLVDQGVGTLVYFEPDERVRGKKFLSVVGKDSYWNDATTWDWFGLKKQINDNCDKLGIVFHDHAVSKKRKKEEVRCTQDPSQLKMQR